MHSSKLPMRHFGLHVGFCSLDAGRRHSNFHVQLFAVLHIESQDVARSFFSWVLFCQLFFADDGFIKFYNKKVFSLHPLSSSGIARDGLVVLEVYFIGQYVFINLLFAPNQAALEVGKYIGRLVFIEYIFVESNMRCGCYFYLHIIICKMHSIITGCGLFAHQVVFAMQIVALVAREGLH